MKAVILAGGLGTRLAEETGVRPKPMVEIGGKPILWHIMKIYAASGIDEFIIALGYKGDMIKEYFLNFYALNNNITVDLNSGKTIIHDGNQPKWKIHLIDTGLSTQTGGRLKRLQPYLGKDEPFMFTYGDGVADINLKELIKFHESHGKLATVTTVRAPSRFGRIAFDDNLITKFYEKPQAAEGWINGGYFMLHPKVIDYIENDESIWERSPIENLAGDHQLAGYRHDGFWSCMDTLKEKYMLENLWQSGDAPGRFGNLMVLSDFLVIGGGIIGISISRELKKLFPDAKVIVIEKEKECGKHGSGRNSGVLHAGFYYSPDSLKAKFTRDGNKLLTTYCEANKIAINKCGKLVVAKDASELDSLDELFRRASINGIEIEEVSDSEARKIEPRVKTFQRALYSPTTSTVDPYEVMQSLKHDAINENIEIHSDVCFIRKNSTSIVTSKGNYQAAYIVNAAGLYADKIALEFGFSEKYRILPFKGLYLYSDEPAYSIKTNIYPVPNLKNPFLGVHFTVTVDGKHKIGPTAIPAFWREHYNGFDNFKLSETLEIIKREAGLFASSNFDFRRLAFEEITKYSRTHMVRLASSLIGNIRKANFTKWGKPGIRAQLLDIKENKLEMDFVMEGDDKSMHVLNAVSPAFTCSIPFSQYICKEIQSRLN